MDTANEAEYVINYDQLVDDVCWRLLARSSFGRVVYCDDGEPGALPVNCAIADQRSCSARVPTPPSSS